MYGLCASVRSNYWRTLRVRAPRPVHYSSVTNDLNRVRAPLHPSALTLGYRVSLASGPLPAQPVDGLSAFGPLISYAIPSVSRPPLRLRATQSPLLRLSPEALFRCITGFQHRRSLTSALHVSPRLALVAAV